jgi:hypothetical protein
MAVCFVTTLKRMNVKSCEAHVLTKEQAIYSICWLSAYAWYQKHTLGYHFFHRSYSGHQPVHDRHLVTSLGQRRALLRRTAASSNTGDDELSRGAFHLTAGAGVLAWDVLGLGLIGGHPAFGLAADVPIREIASKRVIALHFSEARDAELAR